VRDLERPSVQDKVRLGVWVLFWLSVTVSDPGERVGPRLALAVALTDSVPTTVGVHEQVPDSVRFRLPEGEHVAVVVSVRVPDRLAETAWLPEQELVAVVVAERDTEANERDSV